MEELEKYIERIKLLSRKERRDYTIKIDVLKQKPTVENYVIEQDIDAIKMKLSFDIMDEDNCLEDAVLEIQNDFVRCRRK